MKKIIIAIAIALATSISADVGDELDICDAKYQLAVDLVKIDFRYKKIDEATYEFLMRRAGVALAACQYRAATAGEPGN